MVEIITSKKEKIKRNEHENWLLLRHQVVIMPKGRFAKHSGSICYAPINIADNVDILPHGAKSNSLEVVKLRCKVWVFWGHGVMGILNLSNLNWFIKL